MRETSNESSGYMHPEYAKSLSEFGQPKLLEQCNGSILVRKITDTVFYDAMGCYPLFSCEHWSKLANDLDELGDQIVSLAVVTDPFGDYQEAYLKRCFKDTVYAFKEHFVTDLEQPIKTIVSTHHRRNARKASKQVEVELCKNPVDHADDWSDLYANLRKRHGIDGMADFSRHALTQQLMVPGMVMFRAIHGGKTVGMLLWYVHEDVAYYHLAAYSGVGYELRASFALFWVAIEYFTKKNLRWLSLGAGAGISCSVDDGLTRFKSGWATGKRSAYFCGRIYDHSRYAELVRLKDITNTSYFPAYRAADLV